jgi:DNA-binding Lrp family transcriptional regulator
VELLERDELVLSAVSLRGNGSISEIAAELSLPQHLVRNSIDRLKRRDLISPRLYLDLYRLGLTECGLYLSLSSNTTRRQALIKDLISSPHVSWAVEILGDWHLGCSGLFLSIQDFHTFWQSIYDRHPGTIQRATTTVTISVTDYGFAGGRIKSDRSLRYGFSDGELVVVDELSWGILGELAADPTKSKARIAQSLRVPMSTVHYRIERLRDLGIIKGVHFLFNFSASRFHGYRLLVSCDGASSTERKTLEGFCRAHPSIYFMVELIGEWQFEIGVLSKSAAIVGDISMRIRDLFKTCQATTLLCSDIKLLKLSPLPASNPTASQPKLSAA